MTLSSKIAPAICGASCQRGTVAVFHIRHCQGLQFELELSCPTRHCRSRGRRDEVGPLASPVRVGRDPDPHAHEVRRHPSHDPTQERPRRWTTQDPWGTRWERRQALQGVGPLSRRLEADDLAAYGRSDRGHYHCHRCQRHRPTARLATAGGVAGVRALPFVRSFLQGRRGRPSGRRGGALAGAGGPTRRIPGRAERRTPRPRGRAVPVAGEPGGMSRTAGRQRNTHFGLRRTVV